MTRKKKEEITDRLVAIFCTATGLGYSGRYIIADVAEIAFAVGGEKMLDEVYKRTGEMKA